MLFDRSGSGPGDDVGVEPVPGHFPLQAKSHSQRRHLVGSLLRLSILKAVCLSERIISAIGLSAMLPRRQSL